MWRASSDADFHEVVECAVAADGTSPADAFLDELARGDWVADPEHDPPRDEEQIHDHAMLMAKIKFVASYGYPPNATAVNDLDDGIWEFKHGARRLTYWDTDAAGGWTPKPRHDDIRERTTPVPEGGYWWYPDLDETLRLGCAWPKQEQHAPPDKIDEALSLRQEDCDHDRRA